MTPTGRPGMFDQSEVAAREIGQWENFGQKISRVGTPLLRCCCLAVSAVLLLCAFLVLLVGKVHYPLDAAEKSYPGTAVEAKAK